MFAACGGSRGSVQRGDSFDTKDGQRKRASKKTPGWLCFVTNTSNSQLLVMMVNDTDDISADYSLLF